MKIKTDIEIARKSKIKPISEIAKKIKIPEKSLQNYGNFIAKINSSHLKKIEKNKNGKLILVTAINPTAAGEGKTTTSIGLADALSLVGRKSLLCLREPSLGPVFGMKGGATGGGYSQIAPMENINLHFTGDIHAITSANNLLSAMIDNHIYFGNELDIDVQNISWKRALDMNDRALRNINTDTRMDCFNITAASEVMSVFCLACDLNDLKTRLGNIIIAHNSKGKPIYAKDLKAEGAMSVILKDAFMPNLVQTLEGTPAIIHGGPFANIAHGCNCVIATKSALKMSDFVITEAGFGADLGAEKFFDIKCQKAGLKPDAVVLVATIRALKMNGGVSKEDLSKENIEALKAGICNLKRHIENIRKFKLPLVIAINRFFSDTKEEIAYLKEFCNEQKVKVALCSHFKDGGKGALDLANIVLNTLENEPSNFKPLYSNETPLLKKIELIAKEIYRAKDIEYAPLAMTKLEKLKQDGYDNLPVCIAKTQYSFSSDASLLGAPIDHTLTVRDVYLSNGSGFVVIICGNIMTMPGLPRRPAAENIFLDEKGEIKGIF